MKWLALAVVVILPLLAAPVVAGKSACTLWDPVHPDHSAADPTTLAAAWARTLERLSAAIPSLSPKEKQWLQEEMRGDGRRSVRAFASREYAIQQAKRNASRLLAMARRLSDERDRAAQARDWLWFANALIDTDTDHHLARLEAERVIQREAIPNGWTLFVGANFSLQESIRFGRTRLAQHVLSCTLPSVLDVSMVD